MFLDDLKAVLSKLVFVYGKHDVLKQIMEAKLEGVVLVSGCDESRDQES